ncbi:MAG: TlpA family protein disulfide reductase [Acidimicrobiia bacterium]
MIDEPRPRDGAPVAAGAPGEDDLDVLDAFDGSDPPPMGPARKAALVAGVVVMALLAVFVYGVVAGGDDDELSGPSPLDGKLAPAIEGTTLDGGSYTLDDDRGSWVIVNFFATWCPPCVQEHPELVLFEQRHAGDGDRRVVSVVYGGPDEADKARAFFDRNGGSWPVVVDPTGTLSVDYAVAKVPESIIVAPTGVVLGKIRGGVTADQLDAIIDDIETRAGATS